MGIINANSQRQKLSAVVISYNQAALISTCLRALSFADEVIVVDKSSTDGTTDIALKFVDRLVTVPWSPVVEDTRAFAISQCQHEWILCLDDDECLSVEAVHFIQQELVNPRADIYGLPMRHYVLGTHDENAYYWPEYRRSLFRRNAVEIVNSVHNGMRPKSDSIYDIPSDGGVSIHHLSHASVSGFIEKTNRYTSQENRMKADDSESDLAAFAHARIEKFVSKSKSNARDDYITAVAVLRATYDIIDRLKTWEADAGMGGAQEFSRVCKELNALYEKEIPVRKRSQETDLGKKPPSLFSRAGTSFRFRRNPVDG